MAPSDVTHVVCTHGHVDHVGNLNLFLNASFVLDRDVGKGTDCYESIEGSNAGDRDDPLTEMMTIGTDVKVLSTPGHTEHDCSILVESAVGGVNYLVAGALIQLKLLY